MNTCLYNYDVCIYIYTGRTVLIYMYIFSFQRLTSFWGHILNIYIWRFIIIHRIPSHEFLQVLRHHFPGLISNGPQPHQKHQRLWGLWLLQWTTWLIQRWRHWINSCGSETPHIPNSWRPLGTDQQPMSLSSSRLRVASTPNRSTWAPSHATTHLGSILSMSSVGGLNTVTQVVLDG